MNYSIPDTPDNAGFSATVQRRIRADGSRTAAIAAMYRWFGRGLFVVALGAGAGAAFFGYSYITDSTTSMEKVSNAVADALSKVTLKVADVGGTVQIDPNSKVPLDTDGASVKLDTNGAIVRLDSSGGNGNFPRPTPQQLQPRPSGPGGSNTAGGPSGGASNSGGSSPNTSPTDPVKVATDFTVFKHLTLGDGQIITGWKFHSSQDDRPFMEYCYYMIDADTDTSAIFTVARNGVAITAPKGLPIKFQDATAGCQWFDGRPTQSSSSDDGPAPQTAPSGTSSPFIRPLNGNNKT